MVNEAFRRGSSTPRRSRRTYYSRRRHQRLGATSASTGFRSVAPQFLRRVKNRPALRRRSRVHAMIRATAVVGGLVAVAYGARYAWEHALTSPALSIQSIRLHQVPTMLIEPVRARLQPAYGQNLLALDLGVFRQSIEELPAVRQAGIRRVLPGGLVVTVEARTPKVTLLAGTALHVLDAEGVVLDPTGPVQRGLPEIRLVAELGDAASPGRSLRAHPEYGETIGAALAIVERLDESARVVSRPIGHLRLDESGVVLVTAPPLLEIVLGDASRIEGKLAAVQTLMRASPPREPATIDARYADMLVVRAMETETE